ncbi:glycosyl transferase [Leptospira kobayashii]|uniref:Glycosyl transferase n=1 Tax=Leptospira kobayashii TaxID=1917830 RepID=A0ABN6KLV5_9LEPT|nr:glycosyltransferase [Leptospira kobayashii]BDA80478.1 glycosyl transferase [Leptospira kobayashii]
MNVFQHLDELKDSDGVGNDAKGLSNEFTNLGWNSHFVTRLPKKGEKAESSQYHLCYSNLPLTNNDIHILHYAGQGYPLDYFQSLPGKKILRFHNITPSFYYKNTTTPEIYNSMERFESVSYLEIASLAIFCDAAWCDSPYNSYTIKEYDFKNIITIPICKSYHNSDIPLRNNNDGSICFLGRFSPQKKWEDLIDFFFIWIKTHPNSKLYCVGSVIHAFHGYFDLLLKKVSDLDLEGKVLFLQGLSDEEVLQVLSKSDAFVSMSEHEGFCLPVLEAFGMGLPVFAYEQGAIGSTMREGGIRFRSKDYKRLVENMEDYLSDSTKRLTLIQNQKKALEYYNHFPWQKQLSDLVGNL